MRPESRWRYRHGKTGITRNAEAEERKAQAKVSRTKKAYDAALAELSEILDKEEAVLNENLLKAFARSDKTYDEVMAFMGADNEGE